MLGKSANCTPEIFSEGCRVRHYSDQVEGTILELDQNLISLGYPSTTCLVLWDDATEGDVQWTNKLELIAN